MEIGQMFRAQRLRLGLTQSDLAEQSRLSVGIIRRLEAGQQVEETDLFAMADILHITRAQVYEALDASAAREETAYDGYGRGYRGQEDRFSRRADYSRQEQEPSRRSADPYGEDAFASRRRTADPYRDTSYRTAEQEPLRSRHAAPMQDAPYGMEDGGISEEEERRLQELRRQRRRQAYEGTLRSRRNPDMSSEELRPRTYVQEATPQEDAFHAERLAREAEEKQREEARLEEEHLERERLEQERLEEERLERERQENARRERMEQERLDREREELERLERERAEEQERRERYARSFREEEERIRQESVRQEEPPRRPRLDFTYDNRPVDVTTERVTRDPNTGRSYRQMLETAADLAQLTGRETVLEVGCGTGDLTRVLAQRSRFVAALDLSPEALDQNRSRCMADGINNVDFLEGDARRLPIESGSFDAVFVNMLLHHVVSPAQILVEARRVLKPGGCVVVMELMPSDIPAQQRIQNAVEVLKNPTHIGVIPMQDVIHMMEYAALDVADQRVLDQTWKFNDWVSVMGAEDRVDPLRALMRSFALQGNRAGMDLSVDDNGQMTFIYRWMYLVGVAENR